MWRERECFHRATCCIYPPPSSVAGHSSRGNAFCIKGVFYSYSDFFEKIAAIRSRVACFSEPHIGLVANDDLETYASIFACWFEGKSYVPLHPGQPLERCLNIVGQVGITHVLDSSPSSRYAADIAVSTVDVRNVPTKGTILPKNVSDDAVAYILFTSGSTGKPKGVPVLRRNLVGFCHAFVACGFSLSPSDRCLQMFDLTFDLSVVSYLLPLMNGACVYTIPHEGVKYNNIFSVLDEYRLTFALMVPSVIHFLRPYFDEIEIPEMRLSLFCGEALPLDVTEGWAKCVPNARIENVYGPTEDTIFCTTYTFRRDGGNKTSGGILSIGKAMLGTRTAIVNEERNLVSAGMPGELCLAGVQLFNGYWKNPEKDAEVFFEKDGTRFYRTGDLCSEDSDGDILYHGRMDFQVKIQGFRIELGEIETHARAFLGGANAVAVAFKTTEGNDALALFVESETADVSALTDFLRSKMPAYMVPSRISRISAFPLNANGKIDRKMLRSRVEAC